MKKWRFDISDNSDISGGNETFQPQASKTLVFLAEPLGVFHHCFFRCLHFTIDFYYCFWAFSLPTSLFLQVFLFLHWFYYCFSSVFISPTFFPVTIFCQVLPFCAVVPRVLQIWESFFHSEVFLPYTFSQHLTQPVFTKASPGLVVSPWKLQGLLLRFETQTRPICLFSER